MKPTDMRTVGDIRRVTRLNKTAAQIDNAHNKSLYELKDYKFKKNSWAKRNFMLCDFDNTDLRGAVFERCNFSFAVNLDRARMDGNTRFIRCNMAAAQDLPGVNVKTKRIVRQNSNRIAWNTTEIARLKKEEPEGWKEEVAKLEAENAASTAAITAAQNALMQDCNVKVFDDVEVKKWAEDAKTELELAEARGVVDGG